MNICMTTYLAMDVLFIVIDIIPFIGLTKKYSYTVSIRSIYCYIIIIIINNCVLLLCVVVYCCCAVVGGGVLLVCVVVVCCKIGVCCVAYSFK